MNFVEKEICKSKVFQKTNWTESKYQIKGFFEKLPINYMNADFVCTSANDGTHLFRPVSARGHTFWQTQNYNKYVIDNTEDYYIVKSVDSEKICNEIRQNCMDFTS